MSPARAAGFAAAVIALAGCPQLGEPTLPTTAPPRPAISVTRVESPGDVPASAPPAGEWRVHLIDVGTGLSILIQGHDFTLLYDAGSNDPGERPQRILAYLAATIGASGDDLCVAKGAPAPGVRRPIDHVVLSHPHLDHGSAIDEVVHCYDVANFWDSGAVNQAVFYRELLEVIARAKHLAYHTAASPPAGRTITIRTLPVTIPAGVAWTTFGEGDVVDLGADARFHILHAEGKHKRDANENTIVIAVELGGARVLLTGDAGSGRRDDPSAKLGATEQHLVDHFANEIDADILQVAHHGSKTSSRAAFLAAVSPAFALVSAGPRRYGKVVLPDPEVLAALAATGATILRTDERDQSCPVTMQRLGGDTGPGGCDSYILTIRK